ncbi:MAG: hypothetical protein ACJ0Q6_00035 [Candidatus Azotimanducaceae bacterium]|uniref:Uncharacterized protein n=1 Tax=OM182 bacterium TaxID=2510334 RepID=A0A520S321_9GAMM|nr:hypothetical protein [Gammaproteobacteria bacterium]OUV67003.1 MAG: hypothetical protein CBC93_06785 [Gammaproteobacteria bacterium TMED133]RZO76862.1 MAG: hypothetical protein EVA68_03195 [OM182 bacterium]
MASIRETMSTISSGLKSLTELGVTLILAFVVIDVLFPNTTGVIANIGDIVAAFSSEGLVGLIALLLFLLLFKQ